MNLMRLEKHGIVHQMLYTTRGKFETACGLEFREVPQALVVETPLTCMGCVADAGKKVEQSFQLGMIQAIDNLQRVIHENQTRMIEHQRHLEHMMQKLQNDLLTVAKAFRGTRADLDLVTTAMMEKVRRDGVP